MPGYPESKSDCAPEPERPTALCPACGSDNPKVRLPACQFHYQTIRYDNDPDPWHHIEGNDEG